MHNTKAKLGGRYAFPVVDGRWGDTAVCKGVSEFDFCENLCLKPESLAKRLEEGKVRFGASVGFLGFLIECHTAVCFIVFCDNLNLYFEMVEFAR